MSASDPIRKAASLLSTAYADPEYVDEETAAAMLRVARELSELGPRLAVFAAALDDDDRELYRLLDEMSVDELAGLRRSLTTVATYAANAEGRKRAQERKAGGWR
jgi:hypothetical protein